MSDLRSWNAYLNFISAGTAGLAEIIILMIWIYDHKLTDRVSLRLSAAINFTNIINAITLYAFTLRNINCELATFLIVWLANLYVFLSCMIAFNLQYLFLHKKTFNPRLEKWYYFVSIIFSLVTATIPLISKRFGFNEVRGQCWYSPFTELSQIWECMTLIVPITVSIIYCIAIFFAVIIRLIVENRLISAQEGTTMTSTMWDADCQRRTKQIHSTVRRILLYCSIPFITQTGFITYEIHIYLYTQPVYYLELWSVIGRALPGLCNFIVFLNDPAILNALKVIKRDLIERYTGQTLVMDDMLDGASIKTNYLPDFAPVTKGTCPVLRWFVRRFLLSVNNKPATLTSGSITLSQRVQVLHSNAFLQNNYPDYPEIVTVQKARVRQGLLGSPTDVRRILHGL